MEQLNNTSDGKGNGKSKTLNIVIVILVLVIIAFGAVTFYLLKSQNKVEEKRNVLVTEDNAEEIFDEIVEEEESAGDTSYYTVTMEPVWNYSSGDAESQNAVIINADSNVTPVYVNVFLEEDESHIIYKSPVIPLGGELRNIKLDEKLDAGNYACVAEFHLVDEDQNTISMVRVKLTIVVEN